MPSFPAAFRQLLRPSAYGLVPAVLYLSGLHTEVIGGVQRAFLATGLITPTVSRPAADHLPADYSLSLRTLDGKPTTLAALRGKVIFLNLWATWCPPCVAEMPGIQRLYEKNQGADVAFVMVSLDKQPAKTSRFITQRGFTMPVYMLGGALPASFDTESIPTTFIISPAGEIVARHEGMAQYDTPAMSELLQRLRRKAGQ
ncbi:TlpA family protein disulfide reductase [Hymenobacter sp. BT175]|uniref:TlpA family protein disulfide reductase n=1 Tax=Hymenobacter translucens TaxID=2886507 RepID=UPI001D0EBE75|nr:TlpA disulfide reductase family protein [Hymenobacter translucens]MCC2544842.1 TlpA family protein disulfide reductase [Hymenobacter translucens]